MVTARLSLGDISARLPGRSVDAASSTSTAAVAFEVAADAGTADSD